MKTTFFLVSQIMKAHLEKKRKKYASVRKFSLLSSLLLFFSTERLSMWQKVPLTLSSFSFCIFEMMIVLVPR